MIKTRFAPSPTGYLHVGGLRTALYCYLFAKKHKGVFALRIEDTDQERYVEGAMENLIKTLHWVGITYDEGPQENGEETGKCGPYIQSKRTDLYLEHAEKLLANGHAYRCFCTRERLEEMRENQTKNHLPPMYDRSCLNLSEGEIKEKIESKTPFVIRQKIPHKFIVFKDQIRGKMSFDGKTVDDQVLVKSDGFPTYHLANVVDDHHMEITHVIRGEEWLPSTPKHIALYEAFGWTPPEFAHIPLLLNADKTKLSKRQGDVAVEDYIKKGYLKEAIINFIVFLGWNPGGGIEKEIYTLEELEDAFSLEKVHKSGAIFNIEKLDWFNWRWKKEIHLKALSEAAKSLEPEVEIVEQRKGQFKYNFANPENQEKFSLKRGEILYGMVEKDLPESFKNDLPKTYKALTTIEEKILKDPQETVENIKFYFEQDEYSLELLTHEKMRVNLNQAKESLEAGLKDLSSLEDWSEKSLEKVLLETVQKMGIQNGQLLWPLRAALSGKEFSPGVFEAAWVLEKPETLARIEKALNKLNS